MSSNDSMPYDRNVVRFPSCGAELCGLLFTPKASGKVPAIVMAPGFSGVKEGSLMKFAQFFAASGFAVLAFDNINFGDSGGDIRQEADPVLQKRGYRDAITFIGGHDKVDRERIGIWGSSYSGGHVLEVAATDRRVKCVVSQIPLVNGLDGFMRSGGLAQRRNVLKMLDADREARFRGEAPGTIKAVSDKADELCTMPGLAAYNYFTEQQAIAVNWKNEVTLRSVDMLQSQLNDAFIRFISPTPLLVVTVLHDELVATATDLVLAMYEKALEPKKLVMMPGDHFAPYRAGFPVAGQAALEWFRLHLWQQ